MKPTILLIEGGKTQIKAFQDFFQQEGFSSLHSGTGSEGIEVAIKSSPDLVVVGMVLPDMGGVEICRRLKSDDATRTIPLIAFSQKKNREELVAVLQAGAVECIFGPIHPEELRAKILAHLRERDRLEILFKEKKHLENLIENVQEMASRDPLTGLLNRKYGLHQMKNEVIRSNRYNLPLTVTLIDIDHLKTINFDHGQAVGDTLLSLVGKQLRENFRDIDILCRVGNDDFLAGLPHCSREEALTAIGRFQKKISQSISSELPPEIKILFSIGLVLLPDPEIKNEEQLLSVLQVALTRAREKGGGAISFWQGNQEETPNGESK